MNSLEYYDRQKEPWVDKEFNELRIEYVDKQLTICQIADIHRRTPGAISYRLGALGLIISNALARGYSEYINSKLYKEIVENSKVQKSEKVKAKIKTNIEPIIDSVAIVTTSREIIDLKNEVAGLKKDVKEILRLMNMLYEFESQ
jgi:hypothetical protein